MEQRLVNFSRSRVSLAPGSAPGRRLQFNGDVRRTVRGRARSQGLITQITSLHSAA